MHNRIGTYYRYIRSCVAGRSPITTLDLFSTLDFITREPVSFSRFGDGELLYCFEGRELQFQPRQYKLQSLLEKSLLNETHGHFVGFNHQFRNRAEIPWLTKYQRYNKPFDLMRSLLSENDVGILVRPRQKRTYDLWWRIIEHESNRKAFGDASVFFLGLYVDHYARGEMDVILDMFRRLFSGRRILFVAPERPLGGPSFRELETDMKRIGLRSAQFIDIPRENAFASVDDIQTAILDSSGYDDVFIQAGPTATVLASELAGRIAGRVLDVGSLNTQVRFLL